MATIPTSTSTCSFCDRQGLPILPVRYAVARTDLGNAPSLPPSFGADITPIALPDEIAKYTLRLLRPGYLYVYDEHRNEWSGYVVNGQSYLWEFDIHARTPPAVDHHVTFDAVCRGKSDPYVARCVMVKHAARATKVWLGFSDVAWTPAILAQHASADYRRAHMQCIDIAAWRSGGTQPHLSDFEALRHVAEFAADGVALQRETRTYVKAFFPEPFTLQEDITGIHPEAKAALKTLSPMVLSLLVGATGTPTTSGPVTAAAWAFSPHPLHMAREDTDAMTAWGNRAVTPLRPALVGVSDPVGMAMELNGLAIQRSVEHTDHRSRRWKYETAQLIAGVKEAIGHDAVQAKAANQRYAIQVSESGRLAKVGFPTRHDFDAYQARLDQAATLTDAEQHTVARDTWNDYAQYIEKDAWESYVGTASQKGVYQQELDAFTRRVLQPLDVSYIAWLKSPALARYLTHNFDTHDARSGEAYLDVVRLLIADASGRSAVFQLLTELIQQDPRQPDAWLMRALALNHAPLIQAWSTAALAEATASALSWTELAESFLDTYKDLIGDALETALLQPLGTTLADKVARLVYQISGPLIVTISKDIGKGVAGTLPTRLHMGVLGMVAKVGHSDKVVMAVRGTWNRTEAAHTLAGMLAKLAGSKVDRQGVRAALDKLADTDGISHPYHGVLLLEQAKATSLAGASAPQQGYANGELLTPQQFDDVMQGSVSALAKLDVKLSVVQFVLLSVTLTQAYHEMMKANPADAFTEKVNFAGGIIGLVGGVSHTVGKALEHTPFGSSRLAKQYKFFAIEIETRAAWFVGVGKLFGAIGGIIAGAMAIKEGLELWGNHRGLAWLSTVAGGASIVIAAIPIFLVIEGAAAMFLSIAGLIVAIVLTVVAYLKPNAAQDWLERSMYFGTANHKFGSQTSQLQALRAIQ